MMMRQCFGVRLQLIAGLVSPVCVSLFPVSVSVLVSTSVQMCRAWEMVSGMMMTFACSFCRCV